MEEALPLARNFNDAHAKFIDWSVKIEPKVKQKDAQDSEEQVVVRFSKYVYSRYCRANSAVLYEFLMIENFWKIR